MSDQTRHFYEFGRFRINTAERLLLRDSDIVSVTPKVFDILLTLVERTGQIVEKDDLMKRVWPDTFVEEGSLTQNISLLRKALGENPNEPQYIETVSRRGYRFVATVSEIWEDGPEAGNGRSVANAAAFESGVPLARTDSANGRAVERDLIISASGETAASVARSDGAIEGQTISDNGRGLFDYLLSGLKRHHRIAMIAFVAIIVAVAAAAYWNGRGNALDGGASAIESIAVLPFVNDTADPDAEYINDKITESLINSLSKLPKLRVVPRSLVFGYKGQNVDPQKAGRELKVQVVLTGRVQRRGDTLSVQADLIDLENVSQIWGQHYDRKIADILLVEEDISRDIFENLRLKLSLEEQKQLEAYRLYLKGRNYWNKRTPEGLQLGIDYFQQAIRIDEGYAPAYAGLADCYNMLVVYGVRLPKDAFPEAKAAALKALEIDETLAEARTSLAFIKFRWDWDRLEAEKEFLSAIKHRPSYASAHQWYSSYLAAFERFDEAIAEAKRTQELEPLSLIARSHLAWILYIAGRNDEAIAECKKMLDVDPNFFPARRYLGLAYEQMGRYEEAISEFDKGVKLSGSPLMLALLGHAYAASGKTAEARRVLAELEQLKGQKYVSPYTIATIYAALGAKDQAFDQLEKAYEDRDIWLMNLKVDPVLGNLRSDRRFPDLLRRVGLAP